MKQIFLLLIAVFALVGCTKEETSNSELSAIEQKLVGVWYPTTDFENKWYTYNEDGTSIYHNNLSGDIDGVWDVIDENVLIEKYPDSDETLENWQEAPDLKHKIEFSDGDFTLKSTDLNDSSRITVKYKECDPCPPRAAQYSIYFSGSHSGQFDQYSLKTTYYMDDENGELNSEVFNSNLFSGEFYNLTSYDKIGFKYETDAESNANVELIEIQDKDGEVIFSKSDFTIGIGKTFMYEISKDTYTVD